MRIIYQIKKELTPKVTFGKSISYDEFLLLYDEYKHLLPINIFAIEVMNITEGMFDTFRQKKENIIIKPFFSIDEETIEIIREEMQKRFKNSPISYNEFKTIYENYKTMITEKDFAKAIFNINNSFFFKFKKGLHKASIHNDNTIEFITNYNNIYEKYYSSLQNKDIDYQEFLSLYKEYENDLNEIDFATFLGISYNQYRSMKSYKKANGEGYRAKLFNNPKINFDTININELIKLYSNKRINYNEFYEIYEKYGQNIKEDYFARLLGIQFATFPLLKKGKILYSVILKRPLTKKEKNQILNECCNKGLTRRKINTNEFNYYYEPYKDFMTKTDFCYIIGLTPISLQNMNHGITPIALNFTIKEIIPRIKLDLIDYHLHRINIDTFNELYYEYTNLPESTFAYYLGIYKGVLLKMKNNPDYNALIDLYKVERSIINHQLKDKVEVSYEHFKQLSTDIELDIKTIINLYIGENIPNIANKYYEALLQNKKLYLGNIPFNSPDNAEKIIEFCQNYAKAVCIIIQCKEITDEIASEAIAYTWENMGYFELNFKNEWFEIYKPYMIGIMKNWCINYKAHQNISLNTKNNSSKVERIELLATNDDIIQNDNIDNSLYDTTLKLLNDGYSFEEIIFYLSQTTNKSNKEIIDYLKNYMLENNRLTEDSKGNISLTYQ